MSAQLKAFVTAIADGFVVGIACICTGMALAMIVTSCRLLP